MPSFCFRCHIEPIPRRQGGRKFCDFCRKIVGREACRSYYRAKNGIPADAPKHHGNYGPVRNIQDWLEWQHWNRIAEWGGPNANIQSSLSAIVIADYWARDYSRRATARRGVYG